MPTMTARAAEVRKEYRYQIASDNTVKPNYPHANVLELNTNLDSASASALATTVLNATKTHPLAWEIEIDGILKLEDFDLTVNQYTVSAPLFQTDGRSYRLVGCTIDYLNNITTLQVRG